MTVLKPQKGKGDKAMPHKPAPTLICVDCGSDTLAINEYYMVRKSIWQATGLKHNDGCLCIGCLEARIGRELKPKDFAVCPLNYPFHPKLRASERQAWQQIWQQNCAQVPARYVGP
jgi:hypothetical protein